MLALRLRRAFSAVEPDRTASHTTSYLAVLLWLPLLAIGLIEHATRGGIEPILRDLSVHVRILVGIPLLGLAARRLVAIQDAVLRWLRDEDYVDRARLDRLVEALTRRSRGAVARALVAASAVTLAQLYFWGVLMTPAARRVVEHAPHGPAGVWYAWFALPPFYFLLLSIVLRWLLWVGLLVRLAQLPIRTLATHPDRAGGIAYLTLPSVVLSIATATLSAIMAAAWSNEVVQRGQSAAVFRDTLALWTALVVLAAFGPLIAFTPRLMRTRLEGERDYSRLAGVYTRRFQDRWIGPTPDESLLGSADIQALNDLGGAFSYVTRTRLVPFGLAEVLVVIAMTLLPMVPLAVTVVPANELLGRLVKMIL